MPKFQHTRFKSVGAFLDYLPEHEREIVEALQSIIMQSLPECVEKLSYNVPFYYRKSRICYIWPASVPWGGVTSGVSLGFCRGHLLTDTSNYLEKGKRKQIYSKTFHSVDEIDPEMLMTYLYEAYEIDAANQFN
ncbi:MAG: DUF1801 domain-containing protein [Bacteroidetes bacterium]|nr:DUF1801 domain-containing protein [Bacteroidota bacterium]